ncbi:MULTISPECIES: L-lactate permease [Paenibacillus]|uniref:L-lactate permease n=1 Tax=Paenibacillus TaxID=44249 RepID=UPI000887A98D|nr:MULTISPECIES: lactate permease LctP family transporter [Paenibacillus]NTZ20448.1 L-lactate permease [Paenibacillus sp. JMULE4]GCL73758.1 L-lactate transport [Paenibacillus naphthalenovorans]SDI54757.1 lactate permease [Paenibacillus naphthalenovorans]
MEFHQHYDPIGNAFLSTLLAAVPILTLLYLLALHPHKDKLGKKHYGISAPKAALIAAIVTVFMAIWLVDMPVSSAIAAFGYGSFFGLMPIGWIVVAAMFLYTITLVGGQFDIVKSSVVQLSSDRRIQTLLIAFSFGAFIEGAAGFGTPVAIAGALMAGLGFRPLVAAVLCLIANTAPVAYGALGTPIITLANVTGLPEMALSAMAGRQLPFFSILVPFWLIATMVFMHKGKWKQVWEIWPAIVVTGASFAITQFAVSNYVGPMLVDIIAGIISLIALVLLLKVWQPKNKFYLPGEEEEIQSLEKQTSLYTSGQVAKAWAPWAILTLFVFLWGLPQWKNLLNSIHLFGIKSLYAIPVPFLDKLVFRGPPLVTETVPEAAIYNFNWLSAAGTGVFFAAVLSGLFLRLGKDQWKQSVVRTAQRMKTPLITIALVLGLGYTTRYSGLDAILGLAFTKTGVFYPFFAAMIGWLGVFLTGSDTSSNALFGSMQTITAKQLGLDPVLIAASNSTGGVMGKMIDAQSIVVATAACYENRTEGANAVGPIFRAVFFHSIALAALMGILVMLQAYVFPWMIPSY